MKFLTSDKFGGRVGAGRWLAVAAQDLRRQSTTRTRPPRTIAELAANARTCSRFDGSDVMPKEVGSGTFWTGMVEWIQGESSEDTTATSRRPGRGRAA